MTALASRQVEIGGLATADDEAAENDAAKLWRDELWLVLKTFVSGYIDARTGARGYEAVANALARCWEPEGRDVSPAFLRACLTSNDKGNHFRAEWLFWFAARSQDVARLMARQTKPAKTDRQYADDLEETFREKLSHKEAEAAIRRARAR